MNDPYRILGLQAGASSDEITSAYRKLARRFPPELNPRRFAEIHQAYRTLTRLDELMDRAMARPLTTINSLFPPPTVRLRPAPESPPRPGPDDFDVLLHPLRRQLLRELLRCSPIPEE